MTHQKSSPGCIYHVRLKETLNSPMSNWLGEIIILPQENGETILSGRFIDQPALRGFLDQIWNLNLTILSVERIENESPK